MRYRIMAAALCCVVAAQTSPCSAQAASADEQTAAAAAEQAALQAERAAAAAEEAMRAARDAARAARAAANAIRTRTQPPSSQPAPANAVADSLPADENLPVGHAAAGQPAASSASGISDKGLLSAGLAGSVANGSNTGSIKAGAGADFELIASTKDKVASISYTVDVSGQPRPNHLEADLLTLTASGKLDDDNDAGLVGLDGFPDGTSLQLTYAHYSSRVNLDGHEKSQVATARDNCLLVPGNTPAKCDPYAYAGGVSMFVTKYAPDQYHALIDTVMPGSVWFWGGSVSGNQANHKYLDRTAFALKKVSHTGVGAGLFTGWLLGHGATSITGSFDYRRSYKDNESVQICQPLSGGTQVQCLTGSDGAPKRNSAAVFALELRHAFAVDLGTMPKLAIAPKFSVDIHNDAYSLSVPLYFVGDGTGALRGGIRGVYTNQKSKTGGRDTDFAAGLFVGVPFSIFAR